MRNLVLVWLSLFVFDNFVAAQSTTDTTIYQVAETLPLPLLAKCQPEQHPDWPEDSLRRCAESQLLSILAKNIRYPAEARQNNIEGTVVTTFIVEPTGRLSNISILKDIGSGCGAEAVRVLTALDSLGLRWRPATLSGKPVRMKQALPLRFKLQEALPYYISPKGDSIYVEVDSAPQFRGGVDSLISYVLNRLEYPAAYQDSCKTGIIEMAVLVRPNGRVEIDNQLDFSNLGFDFQWQALRLINRTAGLWTPAIFEGKAVTTSIPIRAMFKSDAARCREANERFDQAMILADEGAALSDQNELDKAVEKWTQALALQPDNTELLYYRGTALLSLNLREAACVDLNRVKTLLGTTWFEGYRRVVCGW